MSDPGPQKAPASLARIKAQLQSIRAELEKLTDLRDTSQLLCIRIKECGLDTDVRIRALWQMLESKLEKLTDPPDPFRKGERISFRDNGRVLSGTHVEDEDGGWLTIITDCGQRYQFHRRHLDLVLPTRPSLPAKQLKVGDRVKTLWWGKYVGGTVSSISNDQNSLYPVRVHLEDGTNYWFKPEELELLEDQPKFKVGDRVKTFTHGEKTGTVHSISNDQKTQYPIIVNFDDGSCYYFKPEELEQLP